MPFGSSLASLPGLVTQTVTNAGSQVVGQITQAGAQLARNFGLAGKNDKAVEALKKTVAQGGTNAFKALSADANVKYKVLVDGKVKTLSNAELSQEFSTVDPTASGTGAFDSSGVNEEIAADAAERNTDLKVILSQGPAFTTGNWTDRYTSLNFNTPEAVPNTIVFDVMPTISESRAVNYEPFSPLHHPGEIMKYRGTGGRKWSINGRFIARNREEATLNQIYMNVIRAWTMPFYGQGTDSDEELGKYLGAPPPVLTLHAYGAKNIRDVKCVLTNYDYSWPNDVDYIPTLSGDPFPVIIQISISLEETWSPAEYSSFNLRKFYEGDLSGAMGEFGGRNQGLSQNRSTPSEPAAITATDRVRGGQ